MKYDSRQKIDDFNDEMAQAIKNGFLLADMARVNVVGSNDVWFEVVFIKAGEQKIRVYQPSDLVN